MASRHCRGSPAACSGTRGGHHTQHANAKPHRRRRRSVSCFSVRDAYIEDLDAICDIEHKCFGLKNSWKEEDLEKQFRHSFARMMVYHDEGNTDSARGFLLSWQTGNEMQLLRLAVDPLHQNKGIGSQLMEALLKESQELLTLEVRESNKKALKFYEKFGFQKVATRQHYYSDGENAILMETCTQF